MLQRRFASRRHARKRGRRARRPARGGKPARPARAAGVVAARRTMYGNGSKPAFRRRQAPGRRVCLATGAGKDRYAAFQSVRLWPRRDRAVRRRRGEPHDFPARSGVAGAGRMGRARPGGTSPFRHARHRFGPAGTAAAAGGRCRAASPGWRPAGALGGRPSAGALPFRPVAVDRGGPHSEGPAPSRPRIRGGGSLVAVRNPLWPNSRMVAYADKLLDRDGALTAAAHGLYARVTREHPHFADFIRRTERASEVPDG